MNAKNENLFNQENRTFNTSREVKRGEVKENGMCVCLFGRGGEGVVFATQMDDMSGDRDRLIAPQPSSCYLLHP